MNDRDRIRRRTWTVGVVALLLGAAARAQRADPASLAQREDPASAPPAARPGRYGRPAAKPAAAIVPERPGSAAGRAAPPASAASSAEWKKAKHQR